MATVEIPDAALDRASFDEKKLKLEIACALFAQRKIDLWPAAQLAGLSRGEMEDELAVRNIPVYYVDDQYWEQEQKALEAMERQWPSSSATRQP